MAAPQTSRRKATGPVVAKRAAKKTVANKVPRAANGTRKAVAATAASTLMEPMLRAVPAGLSAALMPGSNTNSMANLLSMTGVKDGAALLSGFESAMSDWQQQQGLSLPALRIAPERLAELQKEYSTELAQLMSGVLEARPAPTPSDKRFATPAWTGSHAYLADLYLLNARFMQRLAENLDVDAKSKAKITFAVSQWVDAMSPSNYFATNPDAQQKLIETRGQSLSSGLINMFADLEKGRISQTDESAFEVGRNVATTPGDVVYQNRIFQLIQYRPATPNVFQRPLLMVPPCINKFYILDLQPESSLVAHTVAAGHTVFMVSWKNPDQNDAAGTWDEYIEEGVIKAIHLVQDISGEKKLNLLGFCVGGTMLATALAVLAAKKEADVAKSLTLLTTLLDFSDTGMLDVFVDEQAVRQRERTIGGHGGRTGLMTGRELATSFSFLRPNDLVWNYVVNNYLKGESPAPFDLLYWNADSTNLPGPFFAWYLRNTYLENRLKERGGVKVCGVPVDFRKITAPTYLYGSRQDHIVPWGSAYLSSKLLGGPLRFVLGASGHIAGVINPPMKKKRSYWTTSTDAIKDLDASTWLEGASEAAGSWWPDWTAWLSSYAGKQIKPKKQAGHGKHKPIEPAPGSYVRQRA
jgi:polyhydroxyalkanoate synthase